MCNHSLWTLTAGRCKPEQVRIGTGKSCWPRRVNMIGSLPSSCTPASVFQVWLQNRSRNFNSETRYKNTLRYYSPWEFKAQSSLLYNFKRITLNKKSTYSTSRYQIAISVKGFWREQMRLKSLMRRQNNSLKIAC